MSIKGYVAHLIFCTSLYMVFLSTNQALIGWFVFVTFLWLWNLVTYYHSKAVLKSKLRIFDEYYPDEPNGWCTFKENEVAWNLLNQTIFK